MVAFMLTAEVSSCERSYGLKSLKRLLSGPLWKKFSNSYIILWMTYVFKPRKSTRLGRGWDFMWLYIWKKLSCADTQIHLSPFTYIWDSYRWPVRTANTAHGCFWWKSEFAYYLESYLWEEIIIWNTAFFFFLLCSLYDWNRWAAFDWAIS